MKHKRTNKRPYSRKRYSNYDSCSEYEKSKIEQGYRRIKEYEFYYLYGKYDKEGNLLYRECFSKFDIDGVKKRRKQKEPTFRLNKC